MITGMSGAGLSTALKVLEDLGYEAVDNLPIPLVPPLVEQAEAAGEPVAVVVDSRNRNFTADGLRAVLDGLRADLGRDVRLLYLEASDEVLQQRFTETRRRHPLATDRPVTDGIQRERELLGSLREDATLALDSSRLSLPDFRRLMHGHFELAGRSGLFVFVQSFSYRLGLPREADLVFDVRFLDNPHYDPDLRPLTGRDAPVGDAIRRDPDYGGFWANLTALVGPLLPRYAREGKSYLTIAVGCTGGRHRSVFVAERLRDWLAGLGHRVALAHRDMDRGPARPAA